MQLRVKYFSYQIFHFWGIVLDLDTYIFSWQTCFMRTGRLQLELSCIQVNVVYCEI